MSVQPFEVKSILNMPCRSLLSAIARGFSREREISELVPWAHCDHRNLRYPLLPRNFRSCNAPWSSILPIYILQEERDRFSTRYLLRYLLQIVMLFQHTNTGFKRCLPFPVLFQVGQSWNSYLTYGIYDQVSLHLVFFISNTLSTKDGNFYFGSKVLFHSTHMSLSMIPVGRYYHPRCLHDPVCLDCVYLASPFSGDMVVSEPA